MTANDSNCFNEGALCLSPKVSRDLSAILCNSKSLTSLNPPFLLIIVAFSRIYLGIHYLTDVAAGALLGFTMSLIIIKYQDKIENLFDRKSKFRKKSKKI